jgi:hypothetical protein
MASSSRSLSERLRAWRAKFGSAIAGRPAGHFTALASEPLVSDAVTGETYAAMPPPLPRSPRTAYAAATPSPPGSSGRAPPPGSRGAALLSLSTPTPLASPRREDAQYAAVQPAPPVMDMEGQLVILSDAARTAAALGWDVCARVARDERDVLLGDDLRSVAAQLRGALAAAASTAQSGASEATLEDALQALDELLCARRATPCCCLQQRRHRARAR